ncbi:hypothetical protein SALBM217S_06731 [Streptomyces griseoloalbus]
MDTAVAAVVRATGAPGALLYILTPDREAPVAVPCVGRPA